MNDSPARGQSPRGQSLRGQLLRATLLVVAWFSLLGAAGAGWLTAGHSRSLQDSALAETGQLLLALLAEHSQEPGESLVRVPPHTEHLVWQAVRADGSMLARSHQAPDTLLLGVDAVDGFHEVMRDAEGLRVYALTDRASGTAIRIAVRASHLQRVHRETWVALVAPVALALAGLALALPLVFRTCLAALDAFSAELSRRRAGDPTPLAPRPVPTELLPIRAAIDGLLARVSALVDRERTFAANAAHELRTPLAAARAQAQLAQQLARGEAARSAAQAVAGCDRMAQIIDRLLALSRADATALSRTEVALDRLAQAALDELRRRHPAVAVTAALQPAAVSADRELLAMALANLIDNAIKHAPGAPVRVATSRTASGAVLVVEDGGPGIAEPLATKRPEPFTRGDTDSEGHGLGLALVARIAEAHRGALTLERSELGGLRATIALPAGDPA